jgi:hypothetical protein
MRERIAVGLGLALIVVALALVLSQRDQRLASTNTRVIASGVELPVASARSRCQHHESVPRSARELRVFATGPGAFDVSIQQPAGRQVTSGHVSGGYPRGSVRVALAPFSRDLSDATVCIINRSRRPLGFAGNFTPLLRLGGLSAPNKGEKGDVVRLDFFRSGHDSWLALIPTIEQRVWLFKGPFESAALIWVILGLLIASWSATIVLLLRRRGDADG